MFAPAIAVNDEDSNAKASSTGWRGGIDVSLCNILNRAHFAKDGETQTKVSYACSVSAKTSSSEARLGLIETSLPPQSRIRASVLSISRSSRTTR